MKSLTELRRVAAVIRSLDGAAAEALLGRLDESTRASVQGALEELENSGGQSASDERWAAYFVDSVRAAKSESQCNAAALDCSDLKEAPLQQLIDSVQDETLANLLCGEHPQTTAVVIARLKPDRAAALLEFLEPAQRAVVLRRVMDLDEFDSEAVATIESHLSCQLRHQILEAQKEALRRQRVRAILGAANPAMRQDLQRIVEQGAESTTITSSQASVQRSVAETSVNFDRLVDCEESMLANLFAEIPPDVSALALAGASQSARKHVLDRLPNELSLAVIQRLESLGPTRVSDIYASQGIVLRLLERFSTDQKPTRAMTLSI